ncbi:MAG: sialidase family protein, partial [Calditrichia bacterium]
MKNRFNLFLAVIVSVSLFGSILSAQEIDSRIWSIKYWQDLANKGLVEITPPHAVPEAAYTGSGIHALSVLIDDSPDVPVTTDPNTTQSENSIFVNPLDNDKALNSNNSTDNPVSSVFGTSGFFTSDFGVTWGGSIQGTGGPNSGDPATAINLNGRYYVGYISDPGGQGVASSDDEGQTWTAHTVAPNPGQLADKNHMWVDNSPTSPFEANLYSAWTDFGGANDAEIMISRSTDDGVSWSTPINISSAVNAGSHNQGVNITTGPNGTVYVAWAIYDSWPSDESAIGFATSTDGGATFSPAVRIITNIRGVRNSETSKNHRVASFPVIDADISGGSRNGWLYVVWVNIGVPGVNNGPDIDVYMIRSTDGGATWSSPIRVNQDPAGQGKEHYNTWLTCDPVTGNLSVIMYDDRNVSSNQCEVFVANSLDGGNTWEDFKVSDVAFTPSPIPGLAGGYFGDYLGISARGGKVYPCWTDNRTGTALTYVSPFALADPEDPNPPDNLSIYSDYTTPAHMMLNWDDPTTLSNGNPISPSDFTIEILRDGNPLTSVAGGTGQFTDNGLNDGQTYTYTLFTKLIANDSTSLEVSATWTAGGAQKPKSPTNFFVTQAGADLMMHWTNPARNIDSTPMDDFDGINLYEDGSFVTAFSRSPGDTGAADSGLYTPPAGTHQYYVTALDNETPVNESDPSGIGYSPLAIPFFDDFPSPPDPNAAYWLNTNGEVTNQAINPPTPDYVLTLDGNPVGGDEVILLPVDLSSSAGQGMIFSYHYQPQGSGNAPETGDSLLVDFLNDQGVWKLVRSYPGTGVVPFVNEIISIDAEDAGPGATFFHPGFQIRFRNYGTSSSSSHFDLWLIDDVFLGFPTNNPLMAVSPPAIVDTLMIGATGVQNVTVSNNQPLPSVLNFTVSENPAVSWLSVSPSAGSVPSSQNQLLDISLDATGLTTGTYTTQLIVAGNDATNPDDMVDVTLEVVEAPVIGVLPDSISFLVAPNGQDSTIMTINNTGGAELNFTLTDADVTGKRYWVVEEKSYTVPLRLNPAKAELDFRHGVTPIDGAGGPDAFGYRWIDSDEPGGPTFNWIDITGSGPPVVLSDDEFVEVPLPFTFSFYGVDQTMVKISSNGYLTFGTDGTDFSNDPIPDSNDPNDIICPFWDDLNPTLGGTIHYESSANQFIVQYTNIQHYGGGGTYTFEVIVNSNGSMLFQYLTLSGNVTSQTIGVENSDASIGLEVVYNAAYVHDNLAIRIASESAWLSENPASGTIPPGGSMDITVMADASGLAEGDYLANLLISSNDPVNPEMIVPVAMTVATGSTYMQDIMTGWNMIGLPLEPADRSATALYPNSVPGTLFGWDGTYNTEDSLDIGKGYWLRFPAAEIVPVFGQQFNSVTIDLLEGWNLIAGPSCNVALTDVSDPGGLIVPGTLFGFNGIYFTTDTITQGDAFWVRSTAAGQISMQCGVRGTNSLAKQL